MIVDGKSSIFVRTGDSGNRISYHFCPVCGSTVYYGLEQAPEIVAIPVGVFADPDFPTPEISLYESRRHTWVRTPADAECFDE